MSEPRNDLARKLWVTLAAGVAAAVVEMMVVLPIQMKLGASPGVVFKSIAAGALGRNAFAGGAATVGLGVFFHTLISLVAAGLYVFATDRLPVLLRRPVSMGLLYGVACYVVMTFGVIPLSRLTFALPKTLLLFSLSFGTHLVAFGLPIAVVARLLLSAPPASVPATSTAH
ncbi:MAG TPA: hypothetical protein VFE18_00475 [Phenylobacterium sp.]|jgi:uncharacterized membrane protein YagU involved in acid resistance|uniref:hypothetical protein n=1 Tax=Phenylobacterium sp. TaxID=1871053 RepID=UPI002D3E83CA|nr:hypothetical protein [Phenylobacterium sp.]HZZ66623.1 hypothetical protein [Phenylobacterium sp.]